MNEDQDSTEASGSATTDYETATARLDEIVARLDSGDAQLRETLDLCVEAKTLIEYCATELAAVDEGLKELRLEDLAASLKPSGAPAETAEPDSATSVPAPEDPPSDDATHTGNEQPPPPEEPPF